MPTYEYHCDGCQENIEVFQSMTADPLEVCPQCGAKKLHRLISGGVGILFKGTGFYCTDYKGHNASTGSSESHESSQETTSHAAKEGKTETSASTPSADVGKSSDKAK